MRRLESHWGTEEFWADGSYVSPHVSGDPGRVRANVESEGFNGVDDRVRALRPPVGVSRCRPGAGPHAASTVKDLTARSGLEFEDAGLHELKGIPETWHLFRVVNAAT